MKKYLINFSVLLGISGITMWIILGKHPISELRFTIKGLIPEWIIIGLLCIMLYWGFETLIQTLLVRRMCKGKHLWNSFKVVMTGHFFNAITPFASGGQPMQVMTMVHQGVPIGTSASVLLSKFIVYQVILTIYSLVVLLLELKFFLQHINGLVYLSLLGFSINLVVVVILVCAAFMKERVKRVGFGLVNILAKLHFIKKPAIYKYKKNIVKQVDLFNSNIQGIRGNARLVFRVTILTVLQLTAYFLIPFAVYRALGMTGKQVFLMISAAAFIVMISSFMPMPGGSGAAEGSFFIFFQIFFPKTILPVAILCWRLITFYVPLLCGALMTMLPNYENRCLKKVTVGARQTKCRS